jgi:O-methyltransferase
MHYALKPAVLRSTLRNAIHWLRLPDARNYTLSASRPLYRPHKTDDFRRLYAEIAPYTLVSPDRCHLLHSCARQATALQGDFIECGVYQGGTAMLLQRAMRSAAAAKELLLFDTFEGMPENNAEGDSFNEGELGETSYEAVVARLGGDARTRIHKGLIPETFRGLETRRFALAHIDVDIYQSIKDCCEFIYPRMSPSGFILFDDYGFPSCAGGKRAVDEFFAGKAEVPIVLPTGQAMVVKMASAENAPAIP